MGFVLGLAEASWISIGLVILPLLVAAFVRHKAKADKSDIMIDVDKKIDKKIEPVIKRLEKHEESINDIKNKQGVIDVKVDFIKEGISDLKDGIGDLKGLFKLVFEKIDQKKDK